MVKIQAKRCQREALKKLQFEGCSGSEGQRFEANRAKLEHISFLVLDPSSDKPSKVMAFKGVGIDACGPLHAHTCPITLFQSAQNVCGRNDPF